MSARGGRGGRGGGRGGFRGPPGTNWGDDLAQFVPRAPQATYPPVTLRVPEPMTEREERTVDRYLDFRRQVHDGPLFTRSRTRKNPPKKTYSKEQENKQYQPPSRATINPFLAVESYSDRFKPPRRTLPDLGKFPFNKALFPKELHHTLDGIDEGNRRSRTAPNGRKSLALPTQGPAATVLDVDADVDADAEARRRFLALISANEGENEEINDLEIDLRAEEDVLDGDEIDDDYQEGDDDDGDDYNAQNYFEEENNDDADDFDGGGDGDDGEIY